MKFMRLFFGLMLTFAASVACACISTQGRSDDLKTSKVFALREEEKICEKNEDCILYTADCCGCNQGGKQGTINKKFVDQLSERKKQLCATTVCIQMISNDPSCKATSAACINATCTISN